MSIQYKVSDHISQFLEPAGGYSTIDVVSNMNWTETPKSGRKNVPKIYFTEYQITAGQLIASLVYIYKLGLGGVETSLTGGKLNAADLYKFKYLATPTKFSYVFPYFNPRKYSRASTFGNESGHSVFQETTNLGRSFIEGLGQKGFWGHAYAGSTVAGNAMGSIGSLANKILPGKLNLDLPQQWDGTSEGEYEFTFDLLNTGTVDEVWDNRNLCYILAYQNTQSRRNAMITDPVCIYEVKCGDIVHMPAAYIHNLNITNLGNTRTMADAQGVKKIIPEAYRINIGFKSLLQPSRQIMNGLDTGDTVTAISDDVEYQQKLTEFRKTIDKTIQQLSAPSTPNQ